MDSVYNNTNIPLNAGQIWEGRSESISKFTVASVSCITDTSGTLNLYFSLNNVNFDFIKTYTLRPNEPFIINQKIEGKWFKARVTNNSGVNQTYLRLTSTYKDDVRSDLDIRPLNDTKDTISIPALNECIVDGKLNVNVEGVTVSGVSVDISGQVVNIGGQTVKSQIYDYNNYAITSQLVGSKRGLDVNNIGTVRAYEGTVIKEIGAFTDIHNKVNLQTYDDALNDKINSCDTIGEDTGAIKVYVSNTANNRVKCDISGNVNVGNFPSTQNISGTVGINNYPATQNISGSVNVGNFPSTQNISGSVSVLNYPTTQDISGNVNVGNFPATQTISGSVSVSNQISGYATSALQSTGNNLLTDIKNKTLSSASDSVSVYAGGENGLDIRALSATVDSVDVGLSTYAWSNSNPPFPATRDVLGAQLCGVNNLAGDSLINLVADASGSLKVAVNNYPSTQNISGSVNVLNFPTTQNISGSVSVTNQLTGFALESGGNLATIATNSNKLTYVGDDLRTVISNTGFDAKVKDGNNNVITSTAYGIDGVRGLDVSIKNATQAEPLVVEIPTTNTINTFSTNLPVSYEITAGGYLSSTTGSLNTHITNTSLTVETGTNALDVNITGGAITGANGKAYLYSGDEATSITATTVSGKNGIDSNIINSSIDTHCYASSNGTNWHHLKSDANGILNIHSMTQDGAGTDITSTLNGAKHSLDVNVANTGTIKVDISGVGLNGNKLNCDVSGQHIALDAQLFSLNTGYTPHVLTCSYTDFYDQQYSLDTASSICTTGFDINGGLRRRELTGKDIVYKTSTSPDNRYALDTTSHIATKGANLTTDPTYMTSSTVNSKNGLDVNVINDTVKVDISGVNISSNRLLTDVSGSVRISDGVDTLEVNSIPSAISTTKGINTQSLMYTETQNSTLEMTTSTVSTGFNAIDTNLTAFNRTNNDYQRLTSVQPVGSANTRALETYSYTVGLNNSSNLLLPITSTTTSSTQSMDTYINNPTSTNQAGKVGLNMYNIYPNTLVYSMYGSASAVQASQFLGPEALLFNGVNMTVGLNLLRTFNIYVSSGPSKLVDIEYVDSLGNLAFLNNVTITTSNTAAILTNAVNVNRLSWSPTSGNSSNGGTVYCKDSTLNVYRNNLSSFNSGSGIITCPNGYVGFIGNLFYNVATGDDLIMVIRDKYNNVKKTRYMPNITPVGGRYHNVGELNEPIYAGDSVYFLSALSGSGQKYLHAIVTLTAV